MLEKLADVDRKYVKSKVEEGFYTSEIEAVRDAVRKMREKEENKNLKEIRTLLAVGLEQIKHGETVPYSADFMDNAMRQAKENHKAGKPIPDELKPHN